MLKQFAGSARMPPSPNITAWIDSAMLMASVAAHGPNRIATSVPATAWPVVPPGSGILNIMARKQNAAATPTSGIFWRGTSSCTWRTARIHTGTMATANTPQVDGLR